MSDSQTFVEVQTTGPSYLGWRGELLAELALARVPELLVHKRSNGASPEMPYDYLACTERGASFFVAVKAFSSFRTKGRDIQTAPEIRWRIDADMVRRARETERPFVLFLFDADTDHGRYVRLDALPAPGPKVAHVTIQFPVKNTLNRESLLRLMAEVERAGKNCCQ